MDIHLYNLIKKKTYFFFSKSYVLFISLTLDIPVDTKIGFLKFKILSIVGKSVISPDPILNHSTPISFNSFAALRLNGVHKYIILCLSQNDLRISWCLSLSAYFFKIHKGAYQNYLI